MANKFFRHLLPTLTKSLFPKLKQVHLEGFAAIEEAWSGLEIEDIARTLTMIEDCPFVDGGFLTKTSVDRRQAFGRYTDAVTANEVDNFQELLERS